MVDVGLQLSAKPQHVLPVDKIGESVVGGCPRTLGSRRFISDLPVDVVLKDLRVHPLDELVAAFCSEVDEQFLYVWYGAVVDCQV